MIFIIFYLIFYAVGFYMGESAKERKKHRCDGKKHIVKRTGWDKSSVFNGRPMFFCHKCSVGFDEKMQKIPDIIEDLLDKKEMAENYGYYYKDWEQIEKYVIPLVNTPLIKKLKPQKK